MIKCCELLASLKAIYLEKIKPRLKYSEDKIIGNLQTNQETVFFEKFSFTLLFKLEDKL